MVGKTISHYQILEKLGEGGMGVVYRARDTHLNRSVALKVLPPEKVAEPERKRRFVQEAQSASALNHPNIIHIYDIDQQDGVDYIAMEYVAGKTLDQFIGRKGLKLGDALKYGVQIADALSRAHAAGIIHRDLKPGNVMVDEHGLVKLLDFGLAKLTEAVPLSEEAPTRTMRPTTEVGTIVGTVAYMSPEQAEGKRLDARSDIFSFGAVLYEMLTGRRAFQKESKTSTLAAILNQEPALLTAEVPHDVEKVVERCLRKDVARRYQHMDDVKIALEELKEDSESGTLAGIPATKRKRPWRWLWAAAVGALLVAALLVWRLREASPPSDLRPVVLTAYSGTERQPSFSPDGKKVAFAWNGEKEDNYDIYWKQIGATSTYTRLTTDLAEDSYPAWSPDDRYIAFLRSRTGGNSLILVPTGGGPERKLDEITGTSALSWTPDAKWLAFSRRDSETGPSSIYAMAVDTGERRRLTTFVTKSAGSEIPLGDSYPSISPDGRNLAFARQLSSYVYGLYVLRLTRDLQPDGEPRMVSNQRYATLPGIAWTSDGREIVYAGGGAQIQSLWRVPVSGRQAPKRLPYALPAAIYPAIARTPPRLVYTWHVLNMNLWRLDTRTKESRLLVSSTYDSRLPRYSPDGRKIAFQSNRSGNLEVWTCDADGSNCLQLTSFGGPQCGSPRWSPDGQWLALDSRSEGQPEIYRIAADGGTPRRMTDHPANDILPSWSRDSRIYFTSDRSGQYELWKMPKDGGKAVQITHSGGYTSFESPDGKHVYYTKFSQPGLFRMPAEGGEERQVLASRTGIGSVTAKGIYYFAPGGRAIEFLDTASGKVSTVAKLEKPGFQLTVSQDDAYIVWVQVDRNTQDLMLVENFR